MAHGPASTAPFYGLMAEFETPTQIVEAAREPYDVVFLDAFGTRNVPPHLTTVEFMRAVRRASTTRILPAHAVNGQVRDTSPAP